MATTTENGWQLESGEHRVDLIDIGEGVNGDFDPAEPDDEPMLCIDVFKRNSDGQWLLIDAAFRRTKIPVASSLEVRQRGLEAIMEQVHQFGAPQSAALSVPTATSPPGKPPALGM